MYAAVLAVLFALSPTEAHEEDFLNKLLNAQQRSFHLVESMQNASGLHDSVASSETSRKTESHSGNEATDDDIELIELLRTDKALRTGFRNWLKEVDEKEKESLTVHSKMADEKEAKRSAVETEVLEDQRKSFAPVSVEVPVAEIERVVKDRHEPLVVQIPVYLKLGALRSGDSPVLDVSTSSRNGDEKKDWINGKDGKDTISNS